MAKFPIYEAQGSPAGVSGSTRRSYDTSSGGAQVGQALQRFGSTVFDVASDVYQMQGEAELAQVMGAGKTAASKMALRFDENADPTTYQEDFNVTWSSEIANPQIKNGWARQEYSKRLPGIRAGLQETLDTAVVRRTAKNWAWSLAQAEANVPITGSFSLVETMMKNGVAHGQMSQEEMDARLDKVKRSSTQQMMASLASTNPGSVLAWKGAPDMQKAYPLSEPTDYAWIHGLAISAKNSRKDQVDTWWSNTVTDVAKKAVEMPFDQLLYEIRTTRGLSDDQVRQLTSVASNAAQYAHDEGKSPYVKTADEPLYAQTLEDIETGILTDRGEIAVRYHKGEKVNFSTSDLERLYVKFDSRHKPIADPRVYSPENPVAVPYFKGLRSEFFDTDDKLLTGKTMAQWVDAYRKLDDAFKKKEVFNNPARMDEEYVLALYDPKIKTKRPGFWKTIDEGLLKVGGALPKPNIGAVDGILFTPMGEQQIPTVVTPIGTTATNAKTGKKLRWDGVQWQPIQ